MNEWIGLINRLCHGNVSVAEHVSSSQGTLVGDGGKSKRRDDINAMVDLTVASSEECNLAAVSGDIQCSDFSPWMRAQVIVSAL
jgi:hypothetical protein